jgi:acetyl esterase
MASELADEAAAVIAEREEQGIPSFSELSVPGARAWMEELNAFDPAALDPVASVRDLSIPGPGGPLTVRQYTPETDGGGPYPVLVYLHGGGWVIGSVDTHDATCRAFADAADCVVVSVDYRRAPEHPFPAPLEDCYAALEWVVSHAGVLDADPDRVAIAGDSAGGNLAAAVAQLARDRDGPALVHQLLIYPVTDHAFDTESYAENAEGYVLTRDGMQWGWDRYLDRPVDGANPYASPLRAHDLGDLPSATVVTAGFDPLRDEGVAYADRLAAAGVDVAHRHYEGMIHGFASMLVEPELDGARDAVAAASDDLRAAFET